MTRESTSQILRKQAHFVCQRKSKTTDNCDSKYSRRQIHEDSQCTGYGRRYLMQHNVATDTIDRSSVEFSVYNQHEPR